MLLNLPGCLGAFTVKCRLTIHHALTATERAVPFIRKIPSRTTVCCPSLHPRGPPTKTIGKSRIFQHACIDRCTTSHSPPAGAAVLRCFPCCPTPLHKFPCAVTPTLQASPCIFATAARTYCTPLSWRKVRSSFRLAPTIL